MENIIDENFNTYYNYLDKYINCISLKNVHSLVSFNDYDYIIVFMGMGYGKTTVCNLNNNIFLDGDLVIREWQSKEENKPPLINIEQFDWDTYNEKVANIWIKNYYKDFRKYRIIFVNNHTYTKYLKGRQLKIIIEYKGLNPYNSYRISNEQKDLAILNHKSLYHENIYYDITIKFKKDIKDIYQFFDILKYNGKTIDNFKNDQKRISKQIDKKHNTVDKKYFFEKYRTSIRRRIIVKDIDISYKNLIPIYDEAFTLLLYKKEKQKKFFLDHQLIILNKMQTIEQYTEYLVEVGAYIKQTAFIENWHLFIDNGILCGESEDYDENEIPEVIDNWVVNEIKHTLDGNENLFYEIFSQGVDEYINKLTIKPKQHISYYRYLTNISKWGLGGSTNIKLNKNNRIQTDRGLMKIKQTKWSNAIQMDTDDIYYKTLTKDHVDVKLVIKVSKGKVRKVMASDTEFYLICNYLDYYISKSFETFDSSTLLYNNKQRFYFWCNFANSTLNDKIKLPIDQDSFDQHCSYRMIRICVDKITDILFSCGMNEMEAKFWKNRVIYLFENNYLIYKDNKIHVKNGLLSGWKWTALLGTMINYSELYIVRSYEKLFFNNEIDEYNVQGDDIMLILLTNIIIVYFIYIMYIEMNFNINPRKFFNSRKRNEYLRKISENGIVTGYPARTIISFLQPGLLTQESFDQMERIQTIANNFYIYLRRGDYDISCLSFLKKQMEHELPGSSELLHYPKSRNGLGYSPLILEDDNYKVMKHNDIVMGNIIDISNLHGIKRSKYIKYIDTKKLYTILADNSKKEYKNKIRWKITNNSNFQHTKPIFLVKNIDINTVINTEPVYFIITHEDRDDIFFENYIDSLEDFESIGQWKIDNYNKISKKLRKQFVLNRFDDSIINSYKYGINLISFIFKRLLFISIIRYLKTNITLNNTKMKRIKLGVELYIEEYLDAQFFIKDSPLYNIIIKD